MKVASKLKLIIFLSGTLTLICFATGMHYMYSWSLVSDQLGHSQALAQSTSEDFEQLLREKVKTALTLANTPLLKQALTESNHSYQSLSQSSRERTITRLDNKWRESTTENDPFILQYTDNRVSKYLKKQLATLEGEYGEIFVTNKYGALVASTNKLTTFAHGHKYWWQEAYHQGQGNIFFDDRGHDASVQGYVLGLVVPVMGENGLLGILKCNLNILGAINRLITQAESHLLGKFQLVRSGGAILSSSRAQPLSSQLPSAISNRLGKAQKGAFQFQETDQNKLIGFADISLTSGQNDLRFGGTMASIDHAQGNRGESWFVLNMIEMRKVLEPVYFTTGLMAIAVIFVLLVLAIAAHILGGRISRPLEEVTQKSRRIAAGDFHVRINRDRKDEIGQLIKAFNQMAEELSQNTTSIAALEKEVALRKQSEAEKEELINELRQALSEVKELQGLLPICSFCKKIRDDQGYWNHVDSYIVNHSNAELTHSICPECSQREYPELDLYDDAF